MTPLLNNSRIYKDSQRSFCLDRFLPNLIDKKRVHRFEKNKTNRSSKDITKVILDTPKKRPASYKKTGDGRILNTRTMVYTDASLDLSVKKRVINEHRDQNFNKFLNTKVKGAYCTLKEFKKWLTSGQFAHTSDRFAMRVYYSIKNASTLNRWLRDKRIVALFLKANKTIPPYLNRGSCIGDWTIDKQYATYKTKKSESFSLFKTGSSYKKLYDFVYYIIDNTYKGLRFGNKRIRRATMNGHHADHFNAQGGKVEAAYARFFRGIFSTDSCPLSHICSINRTFLKYHNNILDSCDTWEPSPIKYMSFKDFKKKFTVKFNEVYIKSDLMSIYKIKDRPTLNRWLRTPFIINILNAAGASVQPYKRGAISVTPGVTSLVESFSSKKHWITFYNHLVCLFPKDIRERPTIMQNLDAFTSKRSMANRLRARNLIAKHKYKRLNPKGKAWKLRTSVSHTLDGNGTTLKYRTFKYPQTPSIFALMTLLVEDGTFDSGYLNRYSMPTMVEDVWEVEDREQNHYDCDEFSPTKTKEANIYFDFVEMQKEFKDNPNVKVKKDLWVGRGPKTREEHLRNALPSTNKFPTKW